MQYHKKEISFSFCFLLEMKLSEWLKLKLRVCVRNVAHQQSPYARSIKKPLSLYFGPAFV